MESLKPKPHQLECDRKLKFLLSSFSLPVVDFIEAPWSFEPTRTVKESGKDLKRVYIQIIKRDSLPYDSDFSPQLPASLKALAQ